MQWTKNRVFDNVSVFLDWLDDNFGDYIENHISGNHVHHTYKPDHASNDKHGTLQLHKNMERYHVNNNGWDDIGQHLTIGNDGKIVLGRDIRKVPVSAKHYNGTMNSHPLAYEMIGYFDLGHDKLEGIQLDSAVKISRYIYNMGKPVIFHRECLINGRAPKSCPGTGVDKTWFMGLVKDDLAPYTQSPKSSTSKSTVINYLEKGNKGEEVIVLQDRLNKIGAYGLVEDGIFGPSTESAVKHFQKSNGLVDDGIVGPLTNREIAEHMKEKKPVVRRGDTGLYVKVVQDAVGATADGKFGSITEAKVRRFQLRNNLLVDGIVGPKTWAKILSM